MRHIFTLLILAALVIAGSGPSGAYAQDRSPSGDFEGTWASSNGDFQTTANALFISISRLELGNRYFVVAVSNASPVFTFVGGGFVRSGGFLQVTTDQGAVWLLTPAFSSRQTRAISISNLRNVESFGTLIPLSEKFEDWPFPLE